jgi:hypothetical protein
LGSRSGLLALDALRARSNTNLRSGARILEERIRDLLNQQPVGQPSGPKPVWVTEQLESALAERTRLLTILGFVLLTIGFFLDLIVKLHLNLIFCGSQR